MFGLQTSAGLAMYEQAFQPPSKTRIMAHRSAVTACRRQSQLDKRCFAFTDLQLEQRGIGSGAWFKQGAAQHATILAVAQQNFNADGGGAATASDGDAAGDQARNGDEERPNGIPDGKSDDVAADDQTLRYDRVKRSRRSCYGAPAAKRPCRRLGCS